MVAVVLLAAAVFQPDIPRTWNSADVAGLELPHPGQTKPPLMRS